MSLVAAPALSSFGSSHASQPKEESAPSGIGRLSRWIIQAEKLPPAR
ncbi:MAG: hypothetical protein NUV68_07935 [Caldiserica bacterium]|nr:hypothetical protein [Caldisericota bacterium]MDH7563212.1 hypothetical protein [Caldisericota bacterium]